MVNLKELPVDHPLRNRPLAEIKAVYRYQGRGVSRPVFPSFGIAKVTFNQLGHVWTNGYEWSCED